MAVGQKMEQTCSLLHQRTGVKPIDRRVQESRFGIKLYNSKSHLTVPRVAGSPFKQRLNVVALPSMADPALSSGLD